MKNKTKHLILLPLYLILFACGEPGKQNQGVNKSQFVALTLEVDIANKNCLTILLAKDGTINRARSGAVDSTDKAFFMGITQDKLFDSLMATVSGDLLDYCNQATPVCDTFQQICHVKFSFLGNSTGIGGEYCTIGSLKDLPEPIFEFITNAIKITDPWYQTQKKLQNSN